MFEGKCVIVRFVKWKVRLRAAAEVGCDGAVLSDLSRTKSGIPRDCVAKIFCQKEARVIGSDYMYLEIFLLNPSQLALSIQSTCTPHPNTNLTMNR